MHLTAKEMADGDDGGGYVYDDEEFLEAIREANGFAGTGEIADAVGCSHDNAYKRLKQLRDDGVVESRQVGNTLVWSLVDD